MSKVKRTRNQIKSKIEAIKKLNDDPKNLNADSLYDKYLGDLPSTNQFLGKKLAGFSDKTKRKKNNNNDIFSELIDIVNQFLDSKKTADKYDVNRPTDNFYENFDKRRLRTHAITAASKTTAQLRNIVSNNVKKVFFAGDEGIESICGSDATLSVDSLTISPKEIDFLNILTINPNTSVGKIVYEPQTPNIGKQKANRNLYNVFSGGVYSYTANNNNTLFDVSWNSGTQKFQISGLTQGAGSIRVDKFLGDYYSSLEFPEITAITKTAMQQILSSDNGETYEFNVATNQIERLCKKLFSICGTQTDRERLKNQNAIDQFDENDEDLEAYFDFDNVEGIDIDSEDARLRKVLRFADCNNFELQVNNDLLKDFVYASSRKTIDDALDSVVNRAATEAFENADSSIALEDFRLSFTNLFILQLPKALVSSVITPKMFLPIVIIYKIINTLLSTFLDIKELFKKLKKLIYFIVKDILWNFVTEFWKLVKRDLLQFISRLVIRIIKNKYKRYVVIITSLIALLRRILNTQITNCADLFGLILGTINTALSTRPPFNIPGILLGLSQELPGYSQDRAFLNIAERLAAAGIPTGPINGEDNDMLSMVKSVIDGHLEESDQNSFVKAANDKTTIPTPFGPITIPPGIINVNGKTF